MDMKTETEAKDELIQNDKTSGHHLEQVSKLEEIQEGNCFPLLEFIDVERKIEVKDEPLDVKEEDAENNELFEMCSDENQVSYFQKAMESSVFYGKHQCDPIPHDSEESSSESDGENDYGVQVLNLDEEREIITQIEEDADEQCKILSPEADFRNTLPTSGEQRTAASSKKNVKRIHWREKPAEQSRNYEWKGGSKEPEPVRSPISYFSYFFDNTLLETIVRESNIYAIQQNPNRPLNMTIEELEQFMGIAIYMSILILPNTRLYWSKYFRIGCVADVMTRDRWEEIKKYIHFNDNSKQLPRDHMNFDKLFKIRPFVDFLQEKVTRRTPSSEFLSLDEQMIPYKGHHSCIQYLPNKPKKWGYKVFVLTGDTGIVYNFEIYTGRIAKLNEFPDIGASGNIVLKLCSVIPRMEHFKLYFNNWFTGIQLLCELSKLGIQSVGTALLTRIPNIEFPSDKQMKKKGRGTVVARSAAVDGINITAVKYFDKRSVIFLTTYAPIFPLQEKMKYDKTRKKDVPVKVPEIVNLYNKHMGGVDKLDQMISLYRNTVKSRKWYHRIFFHFIDMFCATSWLEYKRDSLANGIPSKNIKGLLDFKIEIGEHLCKGGKSFDKKRGRPSGSVDADFQAKKRKGPAKPIPCSSVRLDKVDHIPEYSDKGLGCKLPGCNGKTKVFCKKCEVHLCFTPKHNCFFKFHSE